MPMWEIVRADSGHYLRQNLATCFSHVIKAKGCLKVGRKDDQPRLVQDGQPSFLGRNLLLVDQVMS